MYLGPEGSWSYDASLILAPGCELAEFSTIPEIFEGVADGKVNGAVVPLENSIEGGINYTSDMLIEQESVLITGELMLPVDHVLISLGITGDIRTVASHRQGLAQCRKNIAKLLPDAQLMETSSTSEAARIASKDASIAAVASRNAARKFGLKIISENMSDHAVNVTRFVRIGMNPSQRTGKDRTSIVYMLPENRPGSLWESLSEFAKRGINLSRIESRPSKKEPGSYFFFADIQGHINDDQVNRALDLISTISSYYRWLGSYPADSWPADKMNKNLQ